MLQIHENIKQQRVLAGLSEDDMADRLGIGRSTYQYWERVTPHLQKIKRVAIALNISLSVLTDEIFINDTNNSMANEPNNQFKKEDKAQDENQRERSLHLMVASNMEMNIAHKNVTETNLKLTAMLETLVVGKINLNSPIDISAILYPYLVIFSKFLANKSLNEESEVLATLNTLLIDSLRAGKELGKQV